MWPALIARATSPKVRSAHVIFDRSVTWKKLVPAFRPMFLRFLEESGQMPQDPEILMVLIEENLRELKAGRKPEGFNREGTMRMIFPISERIEFYLYSKTRPTDVPRVAEQVSRVLQKYRLKHAIEWDKLLVFADDR